MKVKFESMLHYLRRLGKKGDIHYKVVYKCDMIDLHVHSQASFDSTESIETILKIAKEKGIHTIAVTDHNTVKGAKEAILIESDVRVIPGIEIDCYFNDKVVHILGYGIDVDAEVYKELEYTYKESLKKIQGERIKKLNELLSYNITHEEYKKFANKEEYTNVEMMQYLFENKVHEKLIPYQKGNRSENPLANFYWDYMSIGKEAYCEMDLPTIEEVVNWIHDTKGVAILAHPKMNVEKEIDVFKELKNIGVNGIEVFCSYHNKDDQYYYESIAKELGWYITCGSDFHGTTKPNIELGQHGYTGGLLEIEKI